MAQPPVIAVTLGNPCGIGPEVVAKALAQQDVRALCLPLVIGNIAAMQSAVALVQPSIRVKEAMSPQDIDPSPKTISKLSPAWRLPHISADCASASGPSHTLLIHGSAKITMSCPATNGGKIYRAVPVRFPMSLSYRCWTRNESPTWLTSSSRCKRSVRLTSWDWTIFVMIAAATR